MTGNNTPGVFIRDPLKFGTSFTPEAIRKPIEIAHDDVGLLVALAGIMHR